GLCIGGSCISRAERETITRIGRRLRGSVTPVRVVGTYFEACNCEAICPCRRQGGQNQFATRMADEWQDFMGRRPHIVADVWVVLNGRPPARLIDPDANVARRGEPPHG